MRSSCNVTRSDFGNEKSGRLIDIELMIGMRTVHTKLKANLEISYTLYFKSTRIAPLERGTKSSKLIDLVPKFVVGQSSVTYKM